MKTTTYTPAFYLVHKNQTIKITEKTIIGRIQGNVILEDNDLLSSMHCELNMSATHLTIKDLNSSNGVIINKTRILTNEDIELHVGDVVKLGRDEFMVLSDEKDVKKFAPPPDRRKERRPENLYTFRNFLTFYSANKTYRSLYFVMVLLAIVSSFMHLKVDVPVPEHLEFLNKLYSEQIIYGGIRLVFVVWLFSLVHSLGMVLYLNRNPIRQFVGVALYLTLLFNVANFNNGPMGEFKSYMVERESLLNLKNDHSAITHLKNITTRQAKLTRAYSFTSMKVTKDKREVLKNDFNEVMSIADGEIKKISLN